MKTKLLFFILLGILIVSCSSDDEGPVFEGDLVISTIDQYNRFDFVHVFGRLIIDGLETEDLSKMNRLKSVGGLEIRNTSLTSLSGLGNLEIIAGDLLLENNENLISLCCLDQVAQVESLQIIDHPNLTSITGLSGLQTVNDTLRIRSAVQLNSLNGLQNLTRVNAPLHLNQMGAQNLEGLENLQEINSLYFKELDQLTSAVEWEQLEFIENYLEIIDCDQLSELRMPGLQTVASIFLGSNPALEIVDFGGVLNPMEFVGIGGSPNLQTIRGFENVTEMGQLDLTELISLQDLLGFSGLTTVYGDLQLNNLTSLNSLEGLENLTSAATEYSGNPVNYTQFSITNLDGLSNLSGLSQLEAVGQLVMRNNDNLSSLDGTNLQSTIPWGYRLNVENNTNLTDYCGFSNFVNTADFNAVLIEGNGYNPTVQQIGSGSDCSL